MVSEIDSILSFFANSHIKLDKEWLDSCITWCKSEELPPNYTLQDLQYQVYQQWLLVDLRDLNTPILPPNVSTATKYNLPNTYYLQLMKIVDISKPKLWQLQKIRNSNVTLAKTWNEENEYGKRVLLLTLTDGLQEIEAMEYKPIKGLNVNLVPGSKVKLHGPVIVRRGRIMLEEKHIEVLGGQVEEILVDNAMENVLARALNRPQNPHPRTIDEKIFVVGKEDVNLVSTTVPRHQNPPQIRKNMNSNTNIGNSLQNQPRSEPNTSQTAQKPSQNRNNKNVANILQNQRNLPLRTEPNTSKTVQNDQQSVLDENNEIFDLVDDDFFNDFELDAHLDNIEKTMLDNNITIAKLKQYIEENKTGTYKIHAKFVSVVEKLTFAENMYKLVIKIIDNNKDELNVRVASDIIENIIGYSPSGIRELKTAVSGNDSNATRTVLKVK